MRIFEAELKSKDNVNSTLDPMMDICNRITNKVYTKLCLGLYQKHKLLVSFMIAYYIMKTECKSSENHLKFII